MKKLIVSLASAAISGATVYLLIDYLFERPSKNVTPEEEIEEDDNYDNTIPIVKVETAAT